jgi:hypothetical protein
VTRLGRAERARGFLLCDDDAFGSELFGCAEAALSGSAGEDRAALAARIDRVIEPFDIAGLRDEARRDWYPVRADDLVAAAPKLGAQPGEIEALLERTGFSPSTPAQRPDESPALRTSP